MRALPSLPGCGQPATVRIEVYSPGLGSDRASLDAVAYACDSHTGAVVAMLFDAGLSPQRTPYQPHPEDVVSPVCGTLRRLTGPTEPTDADVAAYLAAMRLPEPGPVVHPPWCVGTEQQPMHYSAEFPVTGSVALQIQQDHRVTEPVITLMLGLQRRGVSFPLDAAATLGRQLRTAVQTAAG
ncbi:hypothetical protein ACFP2T_13385 [Plantactinospora solaniradicis]|uniref:Uncharacterized protein n=1 Tax=Plantactinospora solaniradicis TaxID=1723736 RepID=A0ABW1K6U0_9ACTN